MELDATLDCNYACPFCTYGDWEKSTAENAGHRFMAREDMELILQRMAEGGVKGVIFTGGGEPLLNPHTPDGLQIARRLGLRAGLFTNGSPLTEPLVDRLLAAAPEFLRISANAATPEIYARFHGLQDTRHAARVWRNIGIVAERLGDAPTSFGLGIVVNEVNYRDLIPVVRRALEIIAAGGRIDYIAFRPVVDYTGPSQIPAEILGEVRRSQEAGLRLVEGSGLRLFFALDYFAEVVAAGERAMVPPTPTHCVGHPWMASVAYTGDVYLCSEGKGQPANRIGNLLEQTLDEIWSSVLRARALCSACQRPPVCKARRLTTRIEPLLDLGPLEASETAVVDRFLSELRKYGHPGDLEFL